MSAPRFSRWNGEHDRGICWALVIGTGLAAVAIVGLIVLAALLLP